MTGLSGSGKSTVAKGLERYLHEQGFLTQMLDGDNMVEFFGGAFVTSGSVFQKIKQCMAMKLEEKQLKRLLREMK